MMVMVMMIHDEDNDDDVKEVEEDEEEDNDDDEDEDGDNYGIISQVPSRLSAGFQYSRHDLIETSPANECP